MGKPHERRAGSTRNPHVKARSQRVAAVGDLVTKVVEAAGLGRSSQRAAVAQGWRDAVGREIAAQTEIQGLRGGVLTVLVGSAALAHELMVYYRRDLLTRLRERTKLPITDLRCKVTGQVSGAAPDAEKKTSPTKPDRDRERGTPRRSRQSEVPRGGTS
jgi:predicted nucleic acid-binding Zn ribbon protein